MPGAGPPDSGLAAPHRRFLADLRAKDMLQSSDPFTDGSGGAHLVLADSLAAAEAAVYADPLHTTGSSAITVHEWEITG
ncbi:YciI family protein [Nocardia grenadensis]|uniref:YciI family protein n=1 Tax=Nocardia grenadensis TaxID=931537 RepID=UPI000ABCC66E|nr:YciI family protein [Nocardia grenadensis]